MLLLNLLTSPLTFLVFALSIIIALTIHEFAHALTADHLGDDTPRLMGRLTLNPIAHLDLVGTLFLLIAGFGWGKPVMVNPRNFANPTLDNLTVSLAGPISNFLLAAVLGLLIRFLPLPAVLESALALVIFFNLLFMTFNLLPIPPLDGSKVWELFLPEEAYLAIQQFGIFVLAILVIFSSSIPVIPFILDRVVGFFFQLLTGQNISLS